MEEKMKELVSSSSGGGSGSSGSPVYHRHDAGE
jgi:hypothetical protein